MKCHVTQNSQKIYSIYNIKYLFAIYISICMSIISHIKREWKKEKETWRMWTTAQGRSTAWCAVCDPQQSRRSRFLPRLDFLCVSWRIVSYSSMAIRDSLCRNWEGAPEKGSLKTEPAGRKRISQPGSALIWWLTHGSAHAHKTLPNLRGHTLNFPERPLPTSDTTKNWETFEYMAQETLPLTLGQITLL